MEPTVTYILNSDSPEILTSLYLRSVPMVPRKGDLFVNKAIAYTVDYVMIDNDNNIIYVVLTVKKDYSYAHLRG